MGKKRRHHCFLCGPPKETEEKVLFVYTLVDSKTQIDHPTTVKFVYACGDCFQTVWGRFIEPDPRPEDVAKYQQYTCPFCNKIFDSIRESLQIILYVPNGQPLIPENAHVLIVCTECGWKVFGSAR